MAEKITISPDERKKITTGDPKNAPKDTFFALNNAVKYSSANQQSTVGKITEIYEEFEEEYPEGDFKDWRNYYYNHYNGRQRLDDATDKAYEMFLTIRAAIDDLDRDDVREFIEGLVLHGTYSNQNAREAIIQKLIDSRSECEPLSPGEGPDRCDLRWGDRYVSIQPEEMRSETLFDRNNVIVFYFSKNKSDNGLTIDISESNMSLDEF
jgi:hypothetical protein